MMSGEAYRELAENQSKALTDLSATTKILATIKMGNNRRAVDKFLDAITATTANRGQRSRKFLYAYSRFCPGGEGVLCALDLPRTFLVLLLAAEL